VTDRVAADPDVERVGHRRRHRGSPRDQGPPRRGRGRRALTSRGRAVDLDPVARRHQHGLGHAGGGADVGQDRGQLVLGEGQVFADRDRRGAPRQPDDEQLGGHAPTARRTK
jgi:hypothetical protein